MALRPDTLPTRPLPRLPTRPLRLSTISETLWTIVVCIPTRLAYGS